ncbi:MAG: CPBP family intramembrane glutamic endopeptidase [Actinomycetota bacterium]
MNRSSDATYLPSARWRYRDVIFAFLAGAIGSAFVAAGVVASGADPFDPVPFSLVFGAQAAFSLLAVWLLSQRRGSGTLADDVGFIVNASDWWGVFAGMALQIAIALVTAPLLFRLWPDGPPTQGVAEIAESSKTMIEQIVVLAVVAVGAPIVEEIIFRGMLLSRLARSMRKWPAIIISAGIFAGVHLVDPSAIAVVPGLFLLGIVLGWVALRRGDLSLAIALHSGINLLAAVTLLYGESILNWAENQLEELEQLEAMIRFLS